MCKAKISLKGSYLPEIGGVSIHISRLASKLEEDGLLGLIYATSPAEGIRESGPRVIRVDYPGLRYTLLQSLAWFFRYIHQVRSHIIHLHGHPVWESPTLWLLVLLRRKIVFTIHDQMMLDEDKSIPVPLQWLFRRLLKKNKIEWIAVNNTIVKQLTRLFVKESHITLIAAYLPAADDPTPLDPEMEQFIGQKNKIVTVYAQTPRVHDGLDLYGIDLALRAFERINQSMGNLGLIICIYKTEAAMEIDAYQAFIDKTSLNDNVLISRGALKNPTRLWKASNVVLRPTSTDGDSLVVREALDAGTTVIASDVVERPEGVILFKTGDYLDLSVKMTDVLTRTAPENNRFIQPSNYRKILDVYSKTTTNLQGTQ